MTVQGLYLLLVNHQNVHRELYKYSVNTQFIIRQFQRKITRYKYVIITLLVPYDQTSFTLSHPWGVCPAVSFSFLLEVKAFPLRSMDSIGTLHLSVELFALPLSSNFVIGSFNFNVLQTKGCL